MTTSLSRSFRLSSTLKIEEEPMVFNKNQGISSILTAASDRERSVKSSSSLQRTLSDEMSSTKWLTQMKKIASSEEFSVSSITESSPSYEGEDEEEEYDEERREQSDDSETEPQSQFDIWNSIQKEVYEKKELEKPGQFDIWSSIISQKEQGIHNNKSPAPPYIHSLVRRSESSLSEKSLEICTESLGSETGSDVLSSYPPSETGDGEDDKEMEQEQQPQEQSQERVTATPSFDFEQQLPKYSYVVSRRSPQRSFLPPIPSLSQQDGASIRMKSRRSHGRLVLEAVSVPSANNFRALRQDGRLVLTFINSYATESVSKNEQLDELEEEFENLEEEEDGQSEIEEEEKQKEEGRGAKEVEFVMEQAPILTNLTTGVMSVHRLTLMDFANTDPRWPKNFNEVVKFKEEEEGHIWPTTIVARSLPSPPRMARLMPKSPATTA